MEATELLTKDILDGLFTTAFEGGSNYWAEVRNLSELRKKYKTDLRSSASEYVFDAIMDGNSLDIYDAENPEELLGTITLDSINKGTSKMLKEHRSHFADALTDNYDATTADVWFQLVTMNEVVFG